MSKLTMFGGLNGREEFESSIHMSAIRKEGLSMGTSFMGRWDEVYTVLDNWMERYDIVYAYATDGVNYEEFKSVLKPGQRRVVSPGKRKM